MYTKKQCPICSGFFIPQAPAEKYCSQDCRIKNSQNKEIERIKQTKNKVPLRHSDKYLRSVYGITRQQYEEMLQIQNNCCLICGCSFEHSPPLVDHDHGTGKVRGILCSPCNNLLGMAKDKISILNSAIQYLKFSQNS